MATSVRLTGVAAGILAASLAASAPAFANGGDFFEELMASWSIADADAGLPYFGFVKDARGKTIANANVTATTPSGTSFSVQTDRMGYYKIPGFTKSVDPKKVTITCNKDGYKLVTRDRRIQRNATYAPIETNCILAIDADKPTA